MILRCLTTYALADHLILNFPAAFAATLLAWGLIDFGDVSTLTKPLLPTLLRMVVDPAESGHILPLHLANRIANQTMQSSLTQHENVPISALSLYLQAIKIIPWASVCRKFMTANLLLR